MSNKDEILTAYHKYEEEIEKCARLCKKYHDDNENYAKYSELEQKAKDNRDKLKVVLQAIDAAED